jgi:hypothetical protein
MANVMSLYFNIQEEDLVFEHTSGRLVARVICVHFNQVEVHCVA